MTKPSCLDSPSVCLLLGCVVRVLTRFYTAIKYPELDAASRQVIWQKFLSLADCVVSAKDLESLAAKSFNGE